METVSSMKASVKGAGAAHRRRAKLDAEEEAVLAKIKTSRPHHYDNEFGGPVRKGKTANMTAAEIQRQRQSIDV